MTLSEELQKLDELRRNGTLSPEEFEMAKRRVLKEIQEDVLADYLEEIQTHDALAQLDREWELERERYMISRPSKVSHRWHRFIPDKRGSVLGGILVVAGSILWMVWTASIMVTIASSIKFSGIGVLFGLFFTAIASLFPLSGILFMVFGIYASMRAYRKAEQYNKAYARYLRRRQSLGQNHKLQVSDQV